MEIWLDTTDLATIANAQSLQILHGVTTNPTLIAQSGKSRQQVIDELLNEQEGPVAVQVIALTSDEALQEARDLFAHSSRLIIKVPAAIEYYPVMHGLVLDGIPVMATALFEPYQAFLSLKLGASYLAPYLGRIADSGKDPADVLRKIEGIKKAYDYDGKVLAAGIRSIEHFNMTVDAGCEAITLPKKAYEMLLATHAGTEKALQDFRK